MKKRSCLTLTVALAAFVLTVPTIRAAFASEVTQILNNIAILLGDFTQIESLAEQAAQTKNQIEAYKLMMQNVKGAPLVEWDDAAQLLAKLQDISQKGQGFAYAGSKSTAAFEKDHPEFAKTAKDGMTSEEYKAAYEKWDQQMRESADLAMQGIVSDKKSITSTGTRLKALQSLNGNAEGQLAALQIGNEYAQVLNEQLLALRSLVHLQIQQQQEFAQNQNSKEVTDAARDIQAFEAPGATTNPAPAK